MQIFMRFEEMAGLIMFWNEGLCWMDHLLYFFVLVASNCYDFFVLVASNYFFSKEPLRIVS